MKSIIEKSLIIFIPAAFHQSKKIPFPTLPLYSLFDIIPGKEGRTIDDGLEGGDGVGK